MSDGEVVEEVSPSRIRSDLMRAHRLHLARLTAGQDDEETVEAEAGALLEAETAVEIHGLHEMVKGYLEAMSKSHG